MRFCVFSHLRWNFVYQRPQHLLSRCAKSYPVFFWEEPAFHDGIEPRLSTSLTDEGVTVVLPELPAGLSEQQVFHQQERLLDQFIADIGADDTVAWYYTPMAVNFSRHMHRAATVYDCMDELSAFRGAPPGLTAAEAELFASADLVFTGGESLYQSKRSRHPSVHLFPSSIDTKHFAKARTATADPPDQAGIPHPRLGYCGVIDERMDTELLQAVAIARPDWHLTMVGPVVKISDADLPRANNIHYLGGKSYQQLPEYLAGWDIGLLPFARNESTRFISPTKTPEYLAAGLRVISTPIRDVVRPYGELGMVEIAETAEQFIAAAEKLLSARGDQAAERNRLAQVDAYLARNSWDSTWAKMHDLVIEVTAERCGRNGTAVNAAEIAAGAES